MEDTQEAFDSSASHWLHYWPRADKGFLVCPRAAGRMGRPWSEAGPFQTQEGGDGGTGLIYWGGTSTRAAGQTPVKLVSACVGRLSEQFFFPIDD